MIVSKHMLRGYYSLLVGPLTYGEYMVPVHIISINARFWYIQVASGRIDRKKE